MMDVIKKNVVSISCGVVTLLAIVAVFLWPMPSWFNGLQAKLEASKSDHDAIKSLIRQSFTKPNLDPSKSEPDALGQFPNAPTIQAGIAIVDKLKEQTAAMEKLAVAMNQRRLLVPGALPNKRGTAWSDFKLEYYRKLNDLKRDMNAVTAPTQEEVAVEAERLKVEDYDKRIQKVGGTEPNRPEVEALYQAHLLRLPDEMRKERAKLFTVFLSDNKTMDCCPGIMPPLESGEYPTDAAAVWATQLTLWIQEDVVQAIAETNQKIPNATVETAIVKRLVTWDIPKLYITKKGEVALVEGQATPQSGGGRFVRPAYVPQRPGATPAAPEGTPEEEAAPSTKVFSTSPTGRVCNSLYDVMHFTVVVDADAQKFRDFMAKLTDNRFITILSVDIVGVDRDREQWRGFLYGPNPVVRLRLNCEAVFLRSWTKKLMPPAVQKLLGIPDATTATAGL
jgi:hypothetical protein